MELITEYPHMNILSGSGLTLVQQKDLLMYKSVAFKWRNPDSPSEGQQELVFIIKNTRGDSRNTVGKSEHALLWAG